MGELNFKISMLKEEEILYNIKVPNIFKELIIDNILRGWYLNKMDG